MAFKMLLCASALCFFGNVAAGSIVGKVIGVSDGDTLKVLDSKHKQFVVRLEGIDAPEKAQAFGNRSKQNLSKLVFGKQVVVESGKVDRYGRTIGVVKVDGIDANLEQIKSGLAWHYKQYAREQSASDRVVYERAETVARVAEKGLWHDRDPTPPWDWRHGAKDEPTPASLSSGCPCSQKSLCAGSRGGTYCLKPNGKKRYSK